MSEMVERVAMAIRQELGVDWPYTGHSELIDVARAAIKEMRNPTVEMIEAGTGFVQSDDAWEAMIDAALKED